MKKSFRLLMAMLLIGSFALSFSSCKDSENASDDPNSPEHIAQSKQTEAAQALLSILSFTSELDSLPDDWDIQSNTIDPTVGIVKDAATPFVRYIPVLDKEEAIAKYNSFAAEKISEDATSASWNIEGVGSLNFQVQNQPDVIATLDVNIWKQPHLTQIRFVPASTLGDNASFEGKPYYNFGDVVSLQEGSNTSYWICVRPCSNIQKKSTSHWISFNLNDWDSHEKKNVPEKSVNFIKLSDKGYADYYLPTQLGNCSGSLEHLQNLFKLLKVLINPEYYNAAGYDHGIGGISKEEFTKDKVTLVSEYWDSENIWKQVLPKHVGRIDFENTYRDGTEINAFYYGYHDFLGLGIYLAKLTNGTILDKKATGRLSWKRTQPIGVDFHDYANWGLQTAEVNTDAIDKLPQKGFIVRYKTGAQLVGKGSDNDEAPAESFMVKHKDAIKDIYVLSDRLSKSGTATAVMGDIITNDNSNKPLGDIDNNEICVLNSSDGAPANWDDCSFFFQISSHKEQSILQKQEIAISAYQHLLNALMLHGYENNQLIAAKLPKFSTDYQTGLNALYKGFDREAMGELTTLEAIVDFQAEDKNGNPITGISEDDDKKIAQFSLIMDFSNSNGERGKLTYNLSSGKYTFSASRKYVVACDESLNLKAYKDGIRTGPAINKDAGQTYKKKITSNRQNVRQATLDFLSKNKVK